MRARWRPLAVAGVVTVCVLAGCARAELRDGVYRSPSGFRVSVPGPGWTVARQGENELVLENRATTAAMTASASCGGSATASPAVLTLQLVAGLRDRTVLERGQLTLGGLTAEHTVLEGRSGPDARPVRVEVYVLRDAGCVYDLVYAAEPDAFAAWRADFQRFAETFARTT